MRSFKLWFRPAVFVGLWMGTVSFTLSELATVAPTLHSITVRERQPARDAKARSIGRWTQFVAR